MNTIRDYLKIYENGFSQNLIDAILAEYGSSDEWLPSAVKRSDGNLYIDKEFRNVETILISRDDIVSRNRERRSEIDNAIFAALTSLVQQYCVDVHSQGTLDINADTGYELLRYPVGGFFKEHADAFDGANRLLSCSVALNDDYQGGEWSFFRGKEKFKAPKGSVLLFPSNFLYPHEILEVKDGRRYSLVTWFN